MSNNGDLSRLICRDMRLKDLPSKDDGDWLWEENSEKAQMEKLKLVLANKGDLSRSVAFSLDKKSIKVKDRFPFFIESDEERLEKIAEICDIIVLERKNDALYAFVIEVKSDKNKNPKANRQIKNGVFFCKWLHRLLNEHCGINKKLEVVKILCYVKPQGAKSAMNHPRRQKNPYWVTDTQTMRYENEHIINLDDARGFYRRKRDKTRKDE